MKQFFLVFFLLSTLYAFFLFQRVDFTVEDLGRHLMNGKQVLEGATSVLYRNVYSYTQPDFPFPNHHWLTGVVFYAVFAWFGLPALYIFHALILLAGLWLMLKLMASRSSLLTTLFLGFFLVLLLAARVVIRPESFGYFFIAYFLLMLARLEKNATLSWRAVASVVVAQILWTNLHISFILGVFLVGTGLLSVVVSHRRALRRLPWKKLVAVGGGTALATLLNPSGWYGAVYPFLMFSNYGYSIVENKSPWFLHTILREPAIPLYFFFALIVAALLLLCWRTISLGERIRVVVGLMMGWMALRNIPIFALLTFPFLTGALHTIGKWQKRTTSMDESARILGIVGCIVLFFLGVPFILSGAYSSGKFRLQSLGAETVQNQFSATEFFKKLNIHGTMFSNYDIGSYLIYALYPDWKVFVDNRPDAFSADFLQNTYIKMQEDDATWRAQLKKYDFHTIFWGYRDMTPWGRAFLAARLKDPDWAPVYVDSMAMIFVRNVPENAAVIQKYAPSLTLPRQ